MARKFSKARVARAEQWLKDLRGAFLDIEDRLKEGIKTKEWEPLGFESLQKFWEAKLSDIPLAKYSGEFVTGLVFAMLEEGSDPVQISTTLNGVGGAAINNIQRKRSEGMTAEQSWVSGHARDLPKGPRARRIFFTLTPDEYEAYAAAVGTVEQMNEFAKRAFVERWKSLYARPRRRKAA
jgi:hypothetical protein